MSDFFSRVAGFNKMYGIPHPEYPVSDRAVVRDRLKRFLEIILDEVNEGTEVMDAINAGESMVKVLASLADWYADIIVYCTSELMRHGIPTDAVLQIIMDSNESKLQADGKPLIVDGKVQKGPNYWKPEPKLEELISTLLWQRQQEALK